MVDAKATMGIFRLHRRSWEKSSGAISQIRAPEPRDLWNVDKRPNTIAKRMKLAKQFGFLSQTGEHSSVCLICSHN